MQKYNCLTCGGELYWEPGEQKLKCQYCDSSFEVKELETQLEDKTEEVQNNSEYIVYSCANCGGEVLATTGTISTICPYCGRAISISEKVSNDFCPDYILPFEISKKQAKEKYLEYIKSSILIPKVFRDEATIEKFQGLYVPYWLHSFQLESLGKVKGENISSHRRGDDRIRTYKNYSVDLGLIADFEDIPTDASNELDNSLMDSLEPFDRSKYTKFNTGYMAGFFAEQPDEKAEETMNRAEIRVEEYMNEKLKQEAGIYDNKILLSSSHNLNNKTTKYAMFPIWLLTVEWKNEKYLFAINGQTGKIVGRLPVDKLKTVAIFTGITLIVNFIKMLILYV